MLVLSHTFSVSFSAVQTFVSILSYMFHSVCGYQLAMGLSFLKGSCKFIKLLIQDPQTLGAVLISSPWFADYSMLQLC